MSKVARIIFVVGWLLGAANFFHSEGADRSKSCYGGSPFWFSSLHTDGRDPKSKRLADWRDVTIELLSTRTNCIAQVRGKESCYSGLFARYDGDKPILDLVMPMKIYVTAFVSDSGKTWAGPEMDFYIETDRGIIGGGILDGRIITWCHSLVTNRPSEKLDLARVIRRFDQEAHEISLQDARQSHKSELWTDLWSYFNNIFRDHTFGGFDFRATEVTGNVVRLDFKNEKKQSTGTAWIDINTKRIVKAIEDVKIQKFRPMYVTREDEKKGRHANQK
jgi:hypothetical protein